MKQNNNTNQWNTTMKNNTETKLKNNNLTHE